MPVSILRDGDTRRLVLSPRKSRGPGGTGSPFSAWVRRMLVAANLVTVVKPQRIRCAVYTRKSTDEGLEQEFNSLDAQRDACEAFIYSQRAEGWVLVPDRYDDGGVSGGTLERPALRRLLRDIERGLVDVIVVYKLDRLS